MYPNYYVIELYYDLKLEVIVDYLFQFSMVHKSWAYNRK